MNTLQLALQFLLSGGIVVGATLLAKIIDAKWSGLLVALPIMTLLGLVFIARQTTPVATQRYLLSAVLFMIPAAIYLLTVYLLYEKVSLPVNLLVALAPMTVVVLVMQKFM